MQEPLQAVRGKARVTVSCQQQHQDLQVHATAAKKCPANAIEIPHQQEPPWRVLRFGWGRKMQEWLLQAEPLVQCTGNWTGEWPYFFPFPGYFSVRDLLWPVRVTLCQHKEGNYLKHFKECFHMPNHGPNLIDLTDLWLVSAVGTKTGTYLS